MRWSWYRTAGLLAAASAAAAAVVVAFFLISIPQLSAAAGSAPPAASQGHRTHGLTWAAETKCPGGQPGPNRFLADTPGLQGNRAAPPLLTGKIRNNPAYTRAAVLKFWANACRDKANAAQFAAAFHTRFGDPLQLFTQKQWQRALQAMRESVDWWGGAHPPSLVYRDFPGYFTDFMVPNRPNKPPRVGYIEYQSGPAWFIKAWNRHLKLYQYVRIFCDQIVEPVALVPPAYVAAAPSGHLGTAKFMVTRGG